MTPMAISWAAVLERVDAAAQEQLAKLWPHPDELAYAIARIACQDWQLLRAELRGEAVAWLVVSTEETPRGRVLLVNGLIGDAPGEDLTAEADTVLDQLARVAGCYQVRMWTERGGLVKKLKARGWSQRHIMERPVYGFEFKE